MGVETDVVKNGAKGLDYSSPTTPENMTKLHMKLVLNNLKIVATITFGGKEYTKIVGTIGYDWILVVPGSSSYNSAIVLSDKNITYDISEGFV